MRHVVEEEEEEVGMEEEQVVGVEEEEEEEETQELSIERMNARMHGSWYYAGAQSQHAGASLPGPPGQRGESAPRDGERTGMVNEPYDRTQDYGQHENQASKNSIHGATDFMQQIKEQQRGWERQWQQDTKQRPPESNGDAKGNLTSG
jgi:hypothetical protein